MSNHKSVTIKRSIANSFSKAAATYDAAAFAEQQIGQRLLDRLAYINLNPVRILDLGCATGYFAIELHKKYPQASIIGVDLAFGMANYANNNNANAQINYCVADAESLPFIENSFDLILANCCFSAKEELNVLYTELQRVLKPNGLLLFSTLGPDTLHEIGLNEHWLDMHHIGDAMVNARFKDPVLDSEKIVFNYDTLRDLLIDLNESGSYIIDNIDALPNLDVACSATYEAIYGSAWGTPKIPNQFKDKNGTVFIAADKIKIL